MDQDQVIDGGSSHKIIRVMQLERTSPPFWSGLIAWSKHYQSAASYIDPKVTSHTLHVPYLGAEISIVYVVLHKC